MTLRTHVMVPYTAVADFGLMYVFVSGSTLECLANMLMCGISTLLNSKKPLSMVLMNGQYLQVSQGRSVILTCNQTWDQYHQRGHFPKAYGSSYL